MNQNQTGQEQNNLIGVIKFENPEMQQNMNKEDSSGDNLSVNDFEHNNEEYRSGRWHPSEHYRFIKGCLQYGNNWKKVKECVKTRSSAQIRSHAQKYIIKLCKKFNIHDNKQLKSFRNIKRKFPSDIMGGLTDNDFPDLKNEEGEITDLNMEQIEEMILGIFKSNSASGNKKLPLNIDGINFNCDDYDSQNSRTEEKKNKVFETVKEPRTKLKKSLKISGNNKCGSIGGFGNSSQNKGINFGAFNEDPMQLWAAMGGLQNMPNMGNIQNIGNMGNMSNLQNMQNMSIPNLPFFNNPNNNLLNDQLLQYLMSTGGMTPNMNTQPSGNKIPSNSNDNMNNLLNLIPFTLNNGEALNEDLITSLLKASNFKPEEANFPSEALNTGINNISGMNTFGNLNDPLNFLNSLNNANFDPNNLSMINDMITSLMVNNSPNNNPNAQNIPTQNNIKNNNPNNSNIPPNNFNDNLFTQFLLAGGNINPNPNPLSNNNMTGITPNSNNSANVEVNNNSSKINKASPENTNFNLNRNSLNEDLDSFDINKLQSLQQISDVLKIISNNPATEMTPDLLSFGNMGNIGNIGNIGGAQVQPQDLFNNNNNSNINMNNASKVKNEEKEGSLISNNLNNMNNLNNNINNINNISNINNQVPSLLSLNPTKPNENILTDDFQMGMLLSLLNPNSNMDMGNFLNFIENQNPNQSQNTNQMLIPNPINNANLNTISSNSNNNIAKKSNDTSNAPDNQTCKEEKEDSFNKTQSQFGFNNNNNNNFGFPIITDQSTQNFNLNNLGGLFNVNVNDPLLGLMNQYLIGQNPSNLNTPAFTSKSGLADNYPFNISAFNPLDLYNMDPNLNFINQNTNNNLK